MSTIDPPQSDDTWLHVSIDSLLAQRSVALNAGRARTAASGVWHGNRQSRQRGAGSDFDDLRPYTAGDEPRHIDWKTSARTHRLHTRVYREEREHRLTLLVDLRQTLFNGTRRLRAAHACHLTACVLWQAIDTGSRVTVICIRDAGIESGPAGVGHTTAINACAFLAQQYRAAESLRPQPGIHAAIPAVGRVLVCSLSQAARQLAARGQSHGHLLWFSAFDDPEPGFEDQMQILAPASRQVAIHLHDEMLENALPNGRYAFFKRYPAATAHAEASLGTPCVIELNKRQAKELRHRLEQAKQRRIERFDRAGISLVSTQQGVAMLVTTLRDMAHLP